MGDTDDGGSSGIVFIYIQYVRLMHISEHNLRFAVSSDSLDRISNNPSEAALEISISHQKLSMSQYKDSESTVKDMIDKIYNVQVTSDLPDLPAQPVVNMDNIDNGQQQQRARIMSAFEETPAEDLSSSDSEDLFHTHQVVLFLYVKCINIYISSE